jgi:hypothetical protein
MHAHRVWHLKLMTVLVEMLEKSAVEQLLPCG